MQGSTVNRNFVNAKLSRLNFRISNHWAGGGGGGGGAEFRLC